MDISPCHLVHQTDRIENVSIVRTYLTILNSADIERCIEVRKIFQFVFFPGNEKCFLQFVFNYLFILQVFRRFHIFLRIFYN